MTVFRRSNLSITTASTITLILLLACHTGAAHAKYVGDHIYLVPAGQVDPKTLEYLKEKLPESFPFDMKVEILPAAGLPQSTYDPSRKQYNADLLLVGYTDKHTVDLRIERYLLVTGEDLFVPKLDFVLGLSYPHKGAAVISLARLKNELYGLKPDNNLFLKRVLKEAVHELGHSWKLGHCPNQKCVMSFSNTPEDTDKKPAKFCVSCRTELRKR